MHSPIAICLACPFRGPANGACPCTVDGRDIKDHAETGECPKGLFVPGAEDRPAESQPAKPKGGPGTELKNLLAKVGITASPTCSCNAMARQMDANPPAWSLENIDAIVDVMRSEAARRKLPFVSAVARGLVRWAVRKAQKEPAKPRQRNLAGVVQKSEV